RHAVEAGGEPLQGLGHVGAREVLVPDARGDVRLRRLVRPAAAGEGEEGEEGERAGGADGHGGKRRSPAPRSAGPGSAAHEGGAGFRSEEHTSELQSRENLVCRLLLEKKKHTQATSQ